MTIGPIDVAYVEILPDLKKFDKNTKDGIKKALDDAGKQADKSSAQIEKSIVNAFKDSTASAAKDLTNLNDRLKAIGSSVTVTMVIDGEEVTKTLRREIDGRIRDEKGRFVAAGKLAGYAIAAGIQESVAEVAIIPNVISGGGFRGPTFGERIARDIKDSLAPLTANKLGVKKLGLSIGNTLFTNIKNALAPGKIGVKDYSETGLKIGLTITQGIRDAITSKSLKGLGTIIGNSIKTEFTKSVSSLASGIKVSTKSFFNIGSGIGTAMGQGILERLLNLDYAIGLSAKNFKGIGSRIGVALADSVGGSLNDRLSKGSILKNVGINIGKNLGSTMLSSLSNVLGRSTKIATAAGTKIGKAVNFGVTGTFGILQDAFKGAFSAIGSLIGSDLGLTIVVALVAAASPLIAAFIASTVGLLTGGAIIAAAAFALKENDKVVTAAKKTASTIKEVFVSAASGLAGPISDALTSIGKDIKSLQPLFTKIFNAITPSIKSLTSAFKPFVSNILNGILKSMPGINAAFAGLAKALPMVGKAFGDFFETLFSDDKLISKITTDIGYFITFLLNVAGPVIKGLTVIFGAFNNTMRILTGGLMGQITQLSLIFDMNSGALGRLKEAWGPLGKAISDVWQALKDFAAAETEEEIKTKLTVLVQKIKETWGPLKEFMTVAWDEIWAFVIRIWDEKVVPWWKEKAKPFLIREVKEGTEEIFGDMGDDIVDSLRALPARAVDALGQLGHRINQKVLDELAGADQWLWNAGFDIIQGLINGMISRYNDLQNTVEDFGRFIREHKGPKSYDLALLRPAGRSIIQGLMNGMDDQKESLRKELASVSGTLSYDANRGGMPLSGYRPSGIMDNEDAYTAEEGKREGIRRWPSSGATDSGNANIHVSSGGSKMDDLLVEIISRSIRIRGGNVQKVLGSNQSGIV